MQINPIKNVERLLKATFHIQFIMMSYTFILCCFSFLLNIYAPLFFLPIPTIFAGLLYLSWSQYDKNKQQVLSIDNHTITLTIKGNIVVSYSLCDITRLEIQAYNRIRYIVIIDCKNQINKSSWLLNTEGYCIRIHDTKENRAFLQQFYTERIVDNGFITTNSTKHTTKREMK